MCFPGRPARCFGRSFGGSSRSSRARGARGTLLRLGLRWGGLQTTNTHKRQAFECRTSSNSRILGQIWRGRDKIVPTSEQVRSDMVRSLPIFARNDQVFAGLVEFAPDSAEFGPKSKSGVIAAGGAMITLERLLSIVAYDTGCRVTRKFSPHILATHQDDSGERGICRTPCQIMSRHADLRRNMP